MVAAVLLIAVGIKDHQQEADNGEGGYPEIGLPVRRKRESNQGLSSNGMIEFSAAASARLCHCKHTIAAKREQSLKGASLKFDTLPGAF